MDKKKVLFVDMDNVLVDFQSGIDALSDEQRCEYEGRLDEVPHIFAKMKPYKGAVEAITWLSKHFDMYILSTSPWENPTACSDKHQWVKTYFPEIFYKRLILTHHKNLCVGDYLIDDRPKNGAQEFCGEWLQFGSSKFPTWEAVVNYLAVKEHLSL